jgi:hypothetical protein
MFVQVKYVDSNPNIYIGELSKSTGSRDSEKKLDSRNIEEKKLSQVNWTTPKSPPTHTHRACRQKASEGFAQNGVLGTAPQSALPRKKTRLSLVSSSSILFRVGPRKRKCPG